VTAAQLLQETQEVLIVNLLDYVRKLDVNYGHLFKPVESGIYVSHQMKPIVGSKTLCFTEKGFKTHTPLKNLDHVEEAVLDEHGEILIPAYMMARKKKFLMTAPNIPVRAICVAELLVREWLDSVLMHRPTTTYEEEISEHFVPEARSLIEQGYIERTCSRLMNELAGFVKCDTWNIYNIRLRNTDLIVEKQVDWRIWDWTRQQELKSFEESWKE
jgi:hypothetical protein